MRRIVMAGAIALTAVLGSTISACATTTAASPPAATPPAISTGAVNTGASTTTARPLVTIEGSVVFIKKMISCGSATACLAVGSAGGPAHETAAAETLRGTKWTSVAVKSPKGVGSVLTGVSCKTATYCLAVGETSTTTTSGLLALTWNGKTLTPIAAPPVPKGDASLHLDTVYCEAVKSCVTVGTSTRSATGGPAFDVYTDTWNGSKWTGVRTVLSNLAPDEFTTLHCFSARSCIGTALVFSAKQVWTMLLATWNGKTWTPEKAVIPAGRLVIASDLSCVSAKSCALTGFSTNLGGATYGFLEVWNGKTWSEARWPAAKAETQVYGLGVSCVSSSNCIAVGKAGTSTSIAAAALSWNGKHWVALKVPGPVKGDSSDFESVSCPKANDCVAIGQVGKTTGFTTSPIAGYWNGKSWRIAAA